MITETLSIVLFANGLALFLMTMCATNNYMSRTDREYKILKEENEEQK